MHARLLTKTLKFYTAGMRHNMQAVQVYRLQVKRNIHPVMVLVFFFFGSETYIYCAVTTVCGIIMQVINFS